MRHEIWICFIIIPIVITLIILAYCLLRRVLLRRKKKVSNHVSLRFPLPPPTGEYDDMDETQYDVRVPALRETKSKESKEEGIGSTDFEADSREEQVPTIATMMREERREEPKLSDSNGKKKEPQFLFEAPPPYDQNILMPPGRRRMVAIELADLPVRKVGDTRVLEAGSSNQSSSTGTAISEPANNSKPGLQAGASEMTGPIRVSLPPTPPSMDMTQRTQASRKKSNKDRKSLKESRDSQNDLLDRTARSVSRRSSRPSRSSSRRDPSNYVPNLAQTQQTAEDEEIDIERQ
uniref:Shugoshin_C domain-containing protein n=2 Tax=Haemonchus contortus TaxID=6289 RepID=A0A7I4XTT1_HAECO